MHVELGQSVRQHRASQVGVAVEVKRLAGDKLVYVGVAAGAKQVVTAPPVGVDTVGHGVARDRGHRAKIRQG
jgi:hypothetical protein